MGVILIVVIVITAYGTDLLLQRILHTTHEEAELLRDMDALAAELRKQRVHQASVDREVALLFAAADADATEFRKLCDGCVNGTMTPEEIAAPSGKGKAAETTGPSSNAAKPNSTEAEAAPNGDHTHAPAPDARTSFKKAQAARRSQIRLAVAAALAGGALLGSVLSRI